MVRVCLSMCGEMTYFSFRIEPIPFETVSLAPANHRIDKLFTIKQPNFFAESVKRLWIPYTCTLSRAETALSMCSGITRLACWVDVIDTVPRGGPKDMLVPIIAALPLTNLSIEFVHFNMLMKHQGPMELVTSLTHLELVFWLSYSSLMESLAPLQSLKQLILKLEKHTVSSSMVAQMMNTIRKTNQSLEYVILTGIKKSRFQEAFAQGVFQPRFTMGSFTVIFMKHICMWEPSRPSHRDPWMDVQRAIAHPELEADAGTKVSAILFLFVVLGVNSNVCTRIAILRRPKVVRTALERTRVNDIGYLFVRKEPAS
jgi:hypothetical protein